PPPRPPPTRRSSDLPPPSRPPPLSPLIPGRSGRPTYSLEALRERVERQFHAETDGRDDILRELDTPAEQRVLLGDIADYLLAVEDRKSTRLNSSHVK